MAGKKKYWEVRNSEIHGSGMFARLDIPAETQVIQYTGEKISKEESTLRGLAWEALARKQGDGLVYIFELNDEYDVDGNTPDNHARLINHSCAPNCEAVIYDEEELWICALRDIKKGEELSFDYGYDISHFLDHPCRCGADNCIGFIVREDQRKKLKKILRKAQKEAEKASKKDAAK